MLNHISLRLNSTLKLTCRAEDVGVSLGASSTGADATVSKGAADGPWSTASGLAWVYTAAVFAGLIPWTVVLCSAAWFWGWHGDTLSEWVSSQAWPALAQDTGQRTAVLYSAGCL